MTDMPNGTQDGGLELTWCTVLTHRDRAILRAVAGGTAELLVGAEPGLFVEGRCCSDQAAVWRLARAGLIAAAVPGAVGRRVPARLTTAGRHELLAS